MKKFYILSLLVMMAMTMSGRQLSPQEALSRISNFATRSADAVRLGSEPIYTLNKDGFVSLYIFDKGPEGYLIVSADDCGMPLLGYSDKENFDYANISPQLKWWLDFYADEIKYASERGIECRTFRTRADRSAISPMLSTQWDQSTPYNDDCPMDNSQRSVTGCVATAMAQAMKYFNWPEKGKGQNSYKWNNQTLSLNFSNVSFDWSNMTDTYGTNSTVVQKSAVAELMYACGISVNMDYSSSESGASSYNIGPALYNYFDYSENIVMPARAFYGTTEWENIIYQQLENGMPVIYGGESDEGGHQFICDGYSSDGYFHFNWGWSGQSDGYYLLSALDPMSQGIGGSTSGYNYSQDIVVNMKPSGKSGTVNFPAFYCYGNFEIESSKISLGTSVKFDTDEGFYNFGVKDIAATFGVKLTDSKGNSQYIAGSATEAIKPMYGIQDYNVIFPSDLANGTYTVSPAYKEKDSSQWLDIPVPMSAVRSLTMVVSNGSAVFSDNEPKIKITDFTIDSNLYVDTNFKSSFTVKNEGTEEFYGEFMFGLLDSKGNEVGETSAAVSVDLKAGQSSTLEYVSEFVSVSSTSLTTGTYTLVMFDLMTGNIFYEYPETVTLQTAPQAELTVTNFGLANGTTVVTDPTTVEFVGTVECLEGYYANQLIVAVFVNGATSTQNYGSSDFLFLNEGDSSEFSVKLSLAGAQEGDEYFAIAYTENRKPLTSQFNFTIGNPDSGVNTVVTDTDNETHFYKLNGLEVSKDNLAPGFYIIKQGSKTCKIMIK